MRAAHDIAPEDVEHIAVEMNWLETTYPSPAFPNSDRRMPGVGSTHYFTAYTWTHGSYPPLRQRLDPGIDSADFDRQVMALQERVEVVGQRTRGSFAPRITVRTRSGDEFSDEFSGDELKWDFATETARISPLFPQMDWPAAKLDVLVAAASGIESAADVARAGSLLRAGVEAGGRFLAPAGFIHYHRDRLRQGKHRRPDFGNHYFHR